MSAKKLRGVVDEKCESSVDEDSTVNREMGMSKEGRTITTRQTKGKSNVVTKRRVIFFNRDK